MEVAGLRGLRVMVVVCGRLDEHGLGLVQKKVVSLELIINFIFDIGEVAPHQVHMKVVAVVSLGSHYGFLVVKRGEGGLSLLGFEELLLK